MSVLMLWSLAFRALERSKVVGVLYECVEGVFVLFSVCVVFAFGDEMWRWFR